MRCGNSQQHKPTVKKASRRSRRLATWQPINYGADALLHRLSTGVDDQSVTIPCTIVPLHDLLPGRHSVTRDVGDARLDAPAMLVLIGAHDLDFQHRNAGLFSNGTPRITGERPRVHAVSNHRVSNAQIVDGHGMGHSVALTFYCQSFSSQGLLDRVYAQVEGAQHTCQLSRNRRLADAREAAEDDQHALTARFQRAMV